MNRGVMTGVVAIGLASLLVLGCSQKMEIPKAGKPRVTTLTIKAQNIPMSMEYVAQTASSRQVNINARVNGFLQKRLYQEGSMVREGQTLFTIDPRPFQVQVNEAKAALDSSKAAHATAKANFDRIKPLVALNALSKKDLDNAKGQYLTTQAAVHQAQAQLNAARLNLSYTTIKSPVDGLAGSASVADGTYVDAIKRVPGAGQATVMGNADQAMRIWLNPDKMASLKVTTTDVAEAVSSQNKLFSAGQIGGEPAPAGIVQTYPAITRSPYQNAEDYENMIIRASNDASAIVRLKDIGRASMGKQTYLVNTRMNGEFATFIQVVQQPGANALDVSKAVRAELDKLQAGFPDGIHYVIGVDTTDYVRISIEEVIKTLIIAICIVIGVIYVLSLIHI